MGTPWGLLSGRYAFFFVNQVPYEHVCPVKEEVKLVTGPGTWTGCDALLQVTQWF